MRSESSRRKFLASAITAIALLLMVGNRLVSRAESQTSQNIPAKAGDTTQEKIARAMSAGPDNISESARIIDTDAQGNKVILREGSNGFTCMVPTGCSKGIAELAPREPRAAPAGVASQTAARGSSNSRHLVLERSLPRR